jgi:hypothetical protein
MYTWLLKYEEFGNDKDLSQVPDYLEIKFHVCSKI